MTASLPTSSPTTAPERQDARTITLIGVAHGSSHFFHLLLPPLFPWLIAEFGVSYAELGAMVSLFFIVSGVGQMLSGFLVDRIGARPILFGALGCFVLAGITASMAQNYAMLMLAAFLAGLGNAPFHPVDFTILNKRVSPKNMGHAFSVHGISGNLGWALAPVFMAGITGLTGSWRLACLGGAVLAALVLALVVHQRRWLDDRAPVLEAANASAASSSATTTATAATTATKDGESSFAFLKLSAVWLCFAFFFFSTIGLSAVQSFAAPAMSQIYGLRQELSSLVVTGFMLCSAAGMIGGGFLVARVQRLERVIAANLLLAAVLLALAGSGWIPGMLALVVASAAGFGQGLAGPSRDMLIKQAAPEGATGRVYGTVYSGLDLGFSVAAPIFGWLMDDGQPRAVFMGAAIALAVSILAAGAVGTGVQKKRLTQRV